MGEHKSRPCPHNVSSFFQRGVLYFRQPYVRSTSFLNKAPQLFSSVANRTNNGGHHGCTPKQVWIRYFFLFSMVFNVVSGVGFFFFFLYDDQWWVSLRAKEKCVKSLSVFFWDRLCSWMVETWFLKETWRTVWGWSERSERERSDGDRGLLNVRNV